MKRLFKLFSLVAIGSLAITSCKKDSSMAGSEEISDATLAKIYAQGFGTSDVQKIEEGYLVEGDIVLTEEFLNTTPGGNFLRIANVEQYRTTNLVTGPRNITLALDSKLAAKAGYTQALQVVRDRYNAENLSLTFSIVSSGANITFVDGHGQYLASAGFPTGGNPYGTVKVNSQSIGTGTTTTFYNFLGTILAHEAGHCIGFRHTDYMDRSYSCGGSYANEGASNVGAVLVPGTPSGPDAGSWMLACVSRNQSRPFNNNDKTALSYLY
jgi:prepilin-type processing-associated H-X9-DG protein